MKDLKIATYKDMKKIPTRDNEEVFALVGKYDETILGEYLQNDMKPFFDGRIIVRDTVARMLARANQRLKEKGLSLKVVYGLRLLEIQKKYFVKRLEAVKKENLDLEEEDLLEKVHSMSAVPEVAGHPTGGAVDLTLYNLGTGKELDMGGGIADFSDKRIETFSDGLSEKQKANRTILLEVMKTVGFCPFYGEWWHFCYGDKEWAFFYNEPEAFYKQVSAKDVVME